MIFREIDFHIESPVPITTSDKRAFRLRINYIVDSIYFNMPKKLRTTLIRKLNCYACSMPINKEFWSNEGIGMVYVPFPNSEEIVNYSQEKAETTVIEVFKQGVTITAKYDPDIKNNLDAIHNLIESSAESIDHYRGIKRSHRTRKYKCEGIVHLQPNKYISIVEVSDKKGNIERFNIKEVEPLLTCVDLGFDKLIWEEDTILGLKKNVRAFELKPDLIYN